MKFGNKYIFPASLSVIIDDIENILECQFVQETETELTVNIVPGISYTKNDSELIKRKLAELIGDKVEIRLSFNDKIKRSPLGKFQFVMTKCPEGRNWFHDAHKDNLSLHIEIEECWNIFTQRERDYFYKTDNIKTYLEIPQIRLLQIFGKKRHPAEKASHASAKMDI